MPATQAPIHIAGIPLKTILRKAVTLIVVGVFFGWIYAWASPWVFPREKQSGLGYGLAHGALMPMALPSLLLGKDVANSVLKDNGATASATATTAAAAPTATTTTVKA